MSGYGLTRQKLSGRHAIVWSSVSYASLLRNFMQQKKPRPRNGSFRFMGQDCNSCGATHIGAHAPTLHVRSYAPPDNGRGHRRPSCCCNRFALASPFAIRPLQRFHRPLLSESFVNGYSSRSSVSRWCYSTTSGSGLQAPFSRNCTPAAKKDLCKANKRP